MRPLPRFGLTGVVCGILEIESAVERYERVVGSVYWNARPFGSGDQANIRRELEGGIGRMFCPPGFLPSQIEGGFTAHSRMKRS